MEGLFGFGEKDIVVNNKDDDAEDNEIRSWFEYGSLSLSFQPSPAVRPLLTETRRTAMEYILNLQKSIVHKVLLQANTIVFSQVLEFIQEFQFVSKEEIEEEDNIDTKSSKKELGNTQTGQDTGNGRSPHNKKTQNRAKLQRQTSFEEDDEFDLVEEEKEEEEDVKPTKMSTKRKSGNKKTTRKKIKQEEEEEEEEEEEDKGEYYRTQQFQFVPTGLIIGGQDTTDNEILLNSLAEHIQDPNKRKVIQLSSRVVTSKKSLIDILANSLGKVRLDAKKRKPHEDPSLFKLSSWCENGKRMIVIIIDDCESFEAENLQRVIRTLSFLRSSKMISIVLLMGISNVTGEQGVHALLKRREIRKMSITKFRPKESILVLDELFSQLFIESSQVLSLRFSKSVLSWLHDRFRFDDFSIHKLLQYLRFAIMEHFSNEPLSFLCLVCKVATRHEQQQKEEKKKNDGKMEPKEWIKIFFERYQKDILDMFPKEEERMSLFNELIIIERHRLSYPYIFDFFKEVGVKLGLLTKNDALARNLLTNSLRIDDMQKRILISSRETLNEIFELAQRYLPAWILEHAKKAWTIEKDFFEDEEEEDEEGEEERNEKKKKYGKPVDYWKWGAAKRRQWELSQTSKKKKNKSRSPLKDGKLGKQISEFLELIASYLVIKNKQISKAFVLDRRKSLEKAFGTNPVQIISRGLCFPRDYLDCDCCQEQEDEDDVYDSTMDDTVVAFKLLKYVGNPIQVNIRDWYNAFADVFNTPSTLKSNKQEEKEILNRFVASACELQYLGFWKPDTQEIAKKYGGDV